MDYERTWLIACERSGRIRDAMLANGIRAISCDTQPSASEGPHLQCDVREILHLPWGGMVAHPPCTRLCNSGVRWLTIPPKVCQYLNDIPRIKGLWQQWLPQPYYQPQ